MSEQKTKTIRASKTSNTFHVEADKKGGMGLVYFARRDKDGKLYAIKTLKNWEIQKEELIDAVTLFRNEGLVWITLGKHENVVQAFWFDQDDGYRPFLVMEYVKGDPRYGVSLQEWLNKEKSLNPVLSLRFALEALNGLIYAQKRVNQDLGISFIHRDIKPDNLLVTTDGTLKVTDFGLVMGRGGTFPYMPPEQWDGCAEQEKSDIYALGCVLYEMVAGRRPFTGATRDDFQHKHLTKDPPPLIDLPPAMEKLIMQCLAKSPDKRPTFFQLKENLQAIYHQLTGEKIQLKEKSEQLSAEDLNARGSGFDELGYYREAVECYAEAIALDSTDPRFYINRASAYLSLENFESALQDYQKALGLDRQAVEAYLGQAYLYIQKGDHVSALACFRNAERVTPKEPLIYVGLGNLHAQKGHYKEAEAYFKKAISIRPGLSEAHLGLGNVHLCKLDYKSAEESYKRAINLNPLYAEACLNLARLYQLTRRLAKRDDAIKMASRLMPAKYADN